MNDARRHICFNLGKVMRRVYSYYQSRLAPYGLTPSQYFVFAALWCEDGVTLGDLGEKVALDASTLTGIIDRMEREGFVQRRPDPEDRRAIRVFLTDKAREVGGQVEPIATELDAELRALFSKEDMETFERVLHVLAERVI